MTKFLIVILLLIAQLAFAQKFSIKGQVADSSSSALPASTVMLLSQKDSTLVNFGVSDRNGFFEIKNINTGEYFLKVTFVGYATYQKNISAKGTAGVIDVGQIKMFPQDKQLDELVIRGEKAPVTVKRDTIEFNAGSFKTKANATVEDLLKKLPGVEVETDGTVRAQGEQVQRVTVDGREFFGRDPKLATRNLPADAIDKVQVFDKKSDQAVFTGIDDGQKEKTINLELKEEKRNGAFGNIMAGYGNNERYQAKANINRFSKGKQLSFLGMGNNINEQGFSFSDFMNFTGGSQQMMGGGGAVRIMLDGNNTNGVPINFGGRQNGIMTNYAGGVNFNRDLSKKTQLTSSYFYNRIDQDIRQLTDRINYLPNQPSYNFNQNSLQTNTNDNHRVNLTLDHKIDSANSIKFANNLTYSQSDQRSNTFSKTFANNNTLQNESARTNNTDQTATDLNSSLLFRHRFPKKGRTFSTNLTLGISQTDSKGNLLSNNQYYGSNPRIEELAQRNAQANASQSYGGTLTYTEPLGGRKYLEGSYAYRTNLNQVDRKVFDEKVGGELKNDQLSSRYHSDYVYNRPSINFRMNRQKYNFALGASYQTTRLKGEVNQLNNVINIDRTFENLLPVARFNYDFTNFKHLRLDYETSMQEPSIQQLQPVLNNSDPLNITLGNPNLRPGYSHDISVNFTTFSPSNFVNLFAFVTAVYTTNAIATSQSVDPTNFVRTSKPVNVKDNLQLNGNFSVGFPVKKINSRFSIGPTASYTSGINLLNDQENRTKQQTLGGTVRYNYTFKEILIIDLSANLSRQQTEYDFNQQQNQAYFNKTYTAEINLTFLKNYQLNSSYNYYAYNSETTNFNQTIPILNLGLSRFLLKNNVGELKVGVNNLLDQSLSVNQTATANYLQQTTSNNLGRYFMVSFTYALNKQLNPMGGGRRGRSGGMQMIINN
jgi:Outer membrane protein beta-barrel family/CarboxypepD_reg-like domain